VPISSLLARSSRWRRWLTGLCLGGLLVLGLATFRDYGMSFDADASRCIGMTSLRYAAGRIKPDFITSPAQQGEFSLYTEYLPTFFNRDYGVGYELPVTLVERLLQLPDDRAKYLFRHLCTFLVSWVGVVALFGLGRQRYGGDWRTGLLAAGLLVLSPRVFGELFYNDKDAVFMALSTVATYTTVRFVERPHWRWAVWHALACALAIDVRQMAVLWPLATVLLLAWRSGRGEYEASSATRRVGALGLYAGLLVVLIVAFWPYLWEAPWTHFAEAFENMRHFRWDGVMLYQGELISSLHVPWHYALVWLGVTTPLLQLALLGLGLAALVWQVARRGVALYGRHTREWQDLLFAGLGVGPLLAVIIFHSVLYDGWRQLYFVYPSLLLVALRGLVVLWQWLHTQRARPRQFVVAGLLAGAVSLAVQIGWMYPLQSLYFNMLAGSEVRQRFEQDYWGISYLQGLKWVLAHDERSTIRVCTEENMTPPLRLNAQVLPEGQRERIAVVQKLEDADYFLASYRYHPAPYNLPPAAGVIKAGRQPVLSVFRLRW
jgi:hypothetical protein